MANSIDGWAAGGTARAPTAAEIAAGFACGPADPELFNGIIQALLECCLLDGVNDNDQLYWDATTNSWTAQAIRRLAYSALTGTAVPDDLLQARINDSGQVFNAAAQQWGCARLEAPEVVDVPGDYADLPEAFDALQQMCFPVGGVAINITADTTITRRALLGPVQNAGAAAGTALNRTNQASVHVIGNNFTVNGNFYGLIAAMRGGALQISNLNVVNADPALPSIIATGSGSNIRLVNVDTVGCMQATSNANIYSTGGSVVGTMPNNRSAVVHAAAGSGLELRNTTVSGSGGGTTDVLIFLDAASLLISGATTLSNGKVGLRSDGGSASRLHLLNFTNVTTDFDALALNAVNPVTGNPF